MNHLPGRIVGLEMADGITLVNVDVAGVVLSAFWVGPHNPAQPLQAGDSVRLLFQEVEVSLARDLGGIVSIRNRLPCTVTYMRPGQLLTRVGLDFAGHALESIITTRSADRLALAPGMAVEALVKSNEMTIG